MHYNVKQFFFNKSNKLNNIAFTAENAQRRIADIIVTYLNYSIFGTEVSKTKVPLLIMQSALSSVI